MIILKIKHCQRYLDNVNISRWVEGDIILKKIVDRFSRANVEVLTRVVECYGVEI